MSGEPAGASPLVVPRGPWRVRESWSSVESTRLRFLLVGAMNSAATFACFAVYQHMIGSRWGYLLSLVATHLTTVLFGFISHRRVTFGVRGNAFRDFSRFELIHLSNLGINALALMLTVNVLRLPVLLAQGIVVLASACYTWFGHSRFTFRRAFSVGDS